MNFTYRGLKAELQRHLVTEEEVNRQLERLRQQNPRVTVISDRPTESGDEVILDYAGFCDGEQFAGGTAENQTLVLGSGTFIPGFEEQLLDKVVCEKVTVLVTFPQQYHAANLAGKEAQFHCTIKGIRVKTEYALDDTFAKEFGGCENLEQMYQKLRESMQAYTDQRAEMDLQDRLIRQAAETLEFTPSEKQLEAELDNQMQNLQAQLAQQGLSLEMYCSFMQTTPDQLRQDARADAETSIKIQAAIETIVDVEHIQVSEEEMGQAIAMIARQNKMTVEQLKAYIDPQFQAAVQRSVLSSKAMQLVRDCAEITVTE
jgi:trigger factor